MSAPVLGRRPGYAGQQVLTDYPFAELGDTPGREAPWKVVTYLGWDDNKYAKVRLSTGDIVEVKTGYLHQPCPRGKTRWRRKHKGKA